MSLFKTPNAEASSTIRWILDTKTYLEAIFYGEVIWLVMLCHQCSFKKLLVKFGLVSLYVYKFWNDVDNPLARQQNYCIMSCLYFIRFRRIDDSCARVCRTNYKRAFKNLCGFTVFSLNIVQFEHIKTQKFWCVLEHDCAVDLRA